MNKKNFNIADLLKNTSFLKWIRNEDGADYDQWEKWERSEPKAKQLKEEAQLIEKGIVFKKPDQLGGPQQAGWDSIVSTINSNRATKQVAQKRIWPKIAAAIGILLIAAAGIYSYSNKRTLVEYQTNFAETETIRLPDGSEVILGANSHLSFYDNLAKEADRMISLDGVAYFKVASQSGNHRFIVQLKDLNIEVIGTAFNVNSHRPNSIVSLTEGNISLKSNDIQQSLVAGETASYNIKNQHFEVVFGQTNYWSSWIEEKWSFGAGTPMKEVIKRIEETYGFDCKIIDISILNKVASGDMSVESQEVLFESLSYLLNIDILEEGKILTFSLKEQN